MFFFTLNSQMGEKSVIEVIKQRSSNRGRQTEVVKPRPVEVSRSCSG